MRLIDTVHVPLKLCIRAWSMWQRQLFLQIMVDLCVLVKYNLNGFKLKLRGFHVEYFKGNHRKTNTLFPESTSCLVDLVVILQKYSRSIHPSQ